MNYRMVNGKMVIQKNGVYFALTKEERLEIRALLDDADSGEGKFEDQDSEKSCKVKNGNSEI
jgi:hypothetical protein